MSLSRKRKKELRKLQTQANNLWESQQVILGEAANVAREAGRQLGHFHREQIKPGVQQGYDKYAAPYVDRGAQFTKRVVNDSLVPAAGAVVGSAMSVWDAASDTRARLAAGRGLDLKAAFKKAPPPPVKSGIGAGGVIAIILGAVAALGVLYAAWQTLRADDELWVADDPLRAPDA